MKFITKTFVAAAALFTSAAFAQSSGSPGLLGQRYAEVGFGIHNLNFASDHEYSAGLGANLPVVPSLLDVGLSYSHDWMHGPFRGHADIFSATPTVYRALNGVKPFAGLGLGWQTTGFGTDAHGLWGATAGVEFAAGDFTFTPRLNYVDDFEVSSASSQQWGWSVEGNYWVTRSTGLFASVGRSEAQHSPAHSWDYQVGLRVKF
jgi:hypothetical protein